MYKVTLATPVSLSLKAMGDDDRRRVQAWFDYLARWDSDPHVRQVSSELPGGERLFLLRTSTDVRIYFTISEKDEEIIVLDVVRKDSIERFNAMPVEKSA